MGYLVENAAGLTLLERRRLHRERLILQAQALEFSRAEARRLVFVRWLAAQRGETACRGEQMDVRGGVTLSYPRREERHG